MIKRMMAFGALTALALVAFASVAGAQMKDDLSQRPAHAGFYIGAQVGGDANLTNISVGPFAIDRHATSAVVGGAVAGFDARFGFLVAGVFGEYNLNLSGDASSIIHPIIYSAKLQNDWRAGVRVGVALDKLLVYVPAFYTQGEAEGTILGTPFSQTLKGWGTGLGLEYALNPTVAFGAQYTFTQWDDIKVGPVNFDTQDHRIVGRLIVRPF